jgi:hypothetical protein
MQDNSTHPLTPAGSGDGPIRPTAGAALPVHSAGESTPPPAKPPKSDVVTGELRVAPPVAGESITLGEILGLGGTKLRQALAKLSKVRGRIKRAAFHEPVYEDYLAATEKLAGDSSGCYKLRSLIGIGLQCGELPQSREGVWGAVLQLTDFYLRRVDYPRPPSLSSKSGVALAEGYASTWDEAAKIAEKKAKASGSESSKLLDRAREVLILDALLCFCAGKLSEMEFTSVVGSLDPPDYFAEPMDGDAPWSFPALLASGAPAGVTVRQATALHGHFDRMSKELAAAQERVAHLEAAEASLAQELTETNEALAEESEALRSAEEAIAKLRQDVATAGTITKHKFDDTRARMLGLLEGVMERHLRTIQTCVDMEPPKTRVAVERVETLLGILEKETAWLRSLG